MNAQNLYLRFDADEAIGAGHLVRCKTLGKAAQALGYNVRWISKHLATGLRTTLFTQRDELIRIKPSLNWCEEAKWLINHEDLNGGIFILDVTTQYSLGHLDSFIEYLVALKTLLRIVLIDGLGVDSIVERISERPHIAVVPYIGASVPKNDRIRDCLWLLGPQYFILQPEYNRLIIQRASSTPVADIAKKILITFGGTDPKKSTLLAMDAVADIQYPDLEIRVVIGPGYSPELKRNTRKKMKESGLNCQLVEAPSNLAELIFWCDLAISGSGLTKYELAALGAPSILISINQEHANVSASFASTGASIHLGVARDVTRKELSLKLKQLIQSKQMRQSMRISGCRLVDDGGAGRLLKVIKESV